MRKVQDDPSLLLRNKMLQEYQKRRQQRLPKGAQEEW
jgi:Ca-activated chloride channel homolog